MTYRRFYAPAEAITADRISLAGEEAHHLKDVLRLRAGDRVKVFDGSGNEFLCTVAGFGKGSVELQIESREAPEVESSLRITLAQALIKGEKFDLVVQKATELGVSRIAPILTEHSDVKLKDQSIVRRIERWRRISLEAEKQSGRCRLVQIDYPQPLPSFCAGDSSQLKLFFAERGGKSLSGIVEQVQPDLIKSVSVLIGPEGGWSRSECEIAAQHGFHAVSLGRRILRTETAAIASLSLVQFLFGDLR